MTTYARIENGVVAEIITIPNGEAIADCFHPDIVANLQTCNSSVAVGYTFAKGKFSPPTPVVVTPVDLISYAAAKRFQAETGGISINGSRVSTDRMSQSLIIGAYNFVQANPSETVHFKTSDGFVELTAEQMTAIANAVGAHVQSAFATESTVAAAISAGTITTTAEIDAASWPVNS